MREQKDLEGLAKNSKEQQKERDGTNQKKAEKDKEVGTFWKELSAT